MKKINNRLKALKYVLYELYYIKKLMKKYGTIMLPGRYNLFPSMRALVLDNERCLECAKPYFEKNISANKTTAIIDRINKSGYYVNRKKGSGQIYEALYSANNSDEIREVKLFSFEKKEILTICTESAKYRKQIDEYEKLHKFYGMPDVEEADSYENAYKISMVDLKNRPAELEALGNIAENTAAYNRENSDETKKINTTEIFEFSYDNEDMNKLLNELLTDIKAESLDMEIPLSFQHGDLSRENLLYGSCSDKVGFWWIDWEHARERVFFYDFFFYMLNTAIYHSDRTAIDLYINGECDEMLEELFKQFGLIYKKTNRREYFIIYAIAFLKERVCDIGHVEALKMYCNYIKKMDF